MSTVDETLEEGRVALFLLERQLKESKTAVPVPSDSSVGSRQSSLNNERKLLDKVPRDARLTYNRSSLGLTIEVRMIITVNQKLSLNQISLRIRKWMIVDYLKVEDPCRIIIPRFVKCTEGH